MDKKDSQIVKGAAIVLMLFYNLFGTVGSDIEFELTGIPGSENIFYAIAKAGHVCVPLFIFVTAYGFCIKEKGLAFDSKKYAVNSLKRCFKLLQDFWYIFAISLAVPYIFGLEYNIETAWGTGKLDRILGIIGNVLGIPTWMESTWYNASWWYITFAMALIFLIPVLRMVVKKLGPFPSLFLSVFLIKTFMFNVVYDNISRYCFIILWGIICAEYDIFERLGEFFGARKGSKPVVAILLFFMLFAGIFIRNRLEQTYLAETFIALIIILLVWIFVKNIPVINKILETLGDNSRYMWWIHCFITVYWFRSEIYSFKNVWVILLLTVLISFGIAFLLKKVKLFFSRIAQGCTSNRRILAFSVVIVALCYAVMCVSSKMVYLTNDDAGIQNLLAGNVTGQPYITHQFINVILGVLISSLYKIFPGIQWWYWYSQLLIVTGMLLIHFVILKLGLKRGRNRTLTILMLSFIDLAFLLYPIANVAFTMVPAILGTGLAAAIFLLEDIKNKRLVKSILVFVFCGYVLVLIHRTTTGLALLCYILLAMLWYLSDKDKFNKKTLMQFVLACMVFLGLTGCIVKVNSVVSERLNGSEFIGYNAARAGWTDYPKDSYYDNPELYEAAGWSEEVYLMASNWGFIAEEIDTESFLYISRNSMTESDAIETSKTLMKSVYADEKCLVLFFAWGCSIIFAIIVFFMAYDLKYIIFICFNNIGTILLLLYQFIIGRMLYRSIFVVLFPAFMINVLLMLKCNAKPRKANKIFMLFIILSTFCIGGFALGSYFDKDRKEFVSSMEKQCKTIEEFGIANQNNIYILNVGAYNCISPWTLYTDIRPANLISWGGSSYNSDNYKKRLEYNGLSSLSGDTFKQDNVYFLCNQDVTEDLDDTSVLSFFLRYLKNEYGAIGFVLEEDIEGANAYVYHFVFPENMDNYESYYDIADGVLVEYEKTE